MNIATGVGIPLKIDMKIISIAQGLYARILIDVDVSKRPSERIIASLKNEKKNINVIFCDNNL